METPLQLIQNYPAYIITECTYKYDVVIYDNKVLVTAELVL